MIPAPHHSPAAERNRAPILAVLQKVLPSCGNVLEIASGTGQHAAEFASALPGWQWQPSDVTDESFDSIVAWCALAGARNALPPRLLDVCDARRPIDDAPFEQPFDAIFCANMLHISPWPTCAGLMRGAARHLSGNGVLITYGPYLETGVPTSNGNLAFDQSLRQRDPAWGLRWLHEVASQAQATGLALAQRFAMPANNLLLVWERAAR